MEERVGEAGRGFFAVSKIKAGSALLDEDPLVSVVDAKCIEDRCSVCFARSKSRCSQCARVFYCGMGCQRKDWTLHKSECKHLKQAAKAIPTLVRLALRLAILYSTRKDDYTRFLGLLSNRERYTSQTIESYGQMTMFLGSLLKDNLDMTPSDMIEMFCRISCNSMAVSDGELVNLEVVEDMFEVFARLKKAKRCKLCLEQQNAVVSWSIEDGGAAENEIEKLLKSDSMDYEAFRLLHVKATTTLPPLSPSLLRLLRSYFHVLLHHEKWSLAKKISEDIYSIISALYPPGHPQLGIQLYATSKLAFLSEAFPSEGTITNLKKAVTFLELSHGVDNEMTREGREKLVEVLQFMAQQGMSHTM
ncbi:SET and MYND domain-containing protein 3 [Dinochytrium kinnereticum]|nr:SET and MYND domain-containing protein 3 [Dinochytrium kinnereticum]